MRQFRIKNMQEGVQSAPPATGTASTRRQAERCANQFTSFVVAEIYREYNSFTLISINLNLSLHGNIIKSPLLLNLNYCSNNFVYYIPLSFFFLLRIKHASSSRAESRYLKARLERQGDVRRQRSRNDGVRHLHHRQRLSAVLAAGRVGQQAGRDGLPRLDGAHPLRRAG
jgi:hypothetical protein